MSDASGQGVCLVTVTYGEREAYLTQLLQYCARTPWITTVVVVDNGSAIDCEHATRAAGVSPCIVRLNKNEGSAGGYRAGIATALALGAPFIWLMDDDNIPGPDALEILLARLTEVVERHGAERSAVMGFRPSHMGEITEGKRHGGRFKRPSSFLAFHVAQLPAKLIRRLGRTQTSRRHSEEPISLPSAPYGGLLAGAETFRSIGLPFKDLVLYADDDEYTSRITRYGGRIELVPSAEINDLEPSWETDRSAGNAFETLLTGGSDMRAYYTTRNQAWVEARLLQKDRLLYLLNKTVYLIVLFGMAAKLNAFRRFGVLRQAIRDGAAGRLGENPLFPVPQSRPFWPEASADG